MTAVAPVATESTHSHFPCVGCGYDLYASKREGLCPECGQSVSVSATAADVFGDINNAIALRKMGSGMLVSSVFAGLCPGACLLALQGENIGGPIAMSIAFSVCAIFAATAETRRRSAFKASPAASVYRSPIFADIIAAVGLLLINFSAYLYALARTRGISGFIASEAVASVLVSSGFFLLCVTAWRALPTWRAYAEIASLLVASRLSKFLRFLSWTKAIYESFWLACCWMPFALSAMGRPMEDLAVGLAMAALFGLFGFAAIWIMMIIAHAILLVQVRRATEPAISCANP